MAKTLESIARAEEYAILKSREREIIHNRKLAMDELNDLREKMQMRQRMIARLNKELEEAQRNLTAFAVRDKPGRMIVGP